MATDRPPGRMAELAVALSLATDLGLGQPAEHGLRTCLLSLAAAEDLGLDGPSRSCVYHVALLRFIGCTSDASETAALVGGDEQAFLAAMAPMAAANRGDAARHVVRHLGENLPLPRRVSHLARALTDPGWENRSLSGHCEVASRLATRIGLGTPVCDALGHAYERWDGNGHPAGLAADAVPVAIRVVAVARDVELWDRRGGWPAVTEVLRRRRGRAHDPSVVDAFVSGGQRWLAGIGDDPCQAALDAEPAPVVAIPEDGLDGALAAVADYADLQSPWRRGHSTGVAALVADAGLAAGLPEPDSGLLAGAGLVHDVGRVGVPSGIWDHPGPLTVDQWERVRMHPYLTERVLQRCPLLRPFAEVAARHHERADGSGYHRGDAGDRFPLHARLLAAADAYHAMTEDPSPPAGTVAGAGGGRPPGNRRVGSARPAGGRRRPGRRRRPPRTDRPGRAPRRPDRPGGGGARPHRQGPCQQAGRRRARHLPQDGGPPHRAHLRQGRRADEGRRHAVRHGARPAAVTPPGRGTGATRWAQEVVEVA